MHYGITCWKLMVIRHLNGEKHLKKYYVQHSKGHILQQGVIAFLVVRKINDLVVKLVKFCKDFI